MRRPRFKAPPEHPLAYYHCISRVVDRQFVCGAQEKEQFINFMRLYARFCGVRVVTYCVMSNHFHVLLEVPQRPARLPDDEALLKLLQEVYRGSGGAGSTRQHLAFLRKERAHAEAEAYRETFLARMWDVSAFMKLLKQRFTQWFNRTRGRKGTLWEEPFDRLRASSLSRRRFKSVLVEGAGTALTMMAAYIDMNPVRAGVVSDPKAYRWCGYAAAVAGVKAAREGLRIVAEAGCGQAVAANAILREYRMLLYGTGAAEGLDERGRPLRRGFTVKEVQAVIAAKGRLDRWQMLRCRVRYFTDGAALGTRNFVNKAFSARREHFGPKRQSGARPMRGVDADAVFTMRDLRIRAVG